MYKDDLALHNLKGLICDKSNQPTNQPKPKKIKNET